jgi:membrane dipeptidase
MQMSYQRRNLLADGCGESEDGGISDFGREAISEMNRLGIAIDLSHAGDRTMVETIEASEKPVFFSHSNARALVEHRRNVTDSTLQALAARGGVCCVSAYSDFLVAKGSSVGTSLDDLARTARYVVDLIGIDHVGFGLDAGEMRTADEMEILTAAIGGGSDIGKRYAIRSRTDLPEYADALGRAGFDATSIDKLLGGNMLRFFDEVWRR